MIGNQYRCLAVESGQEGPERERCQTQRQHGAMEETHHLGAAKRPKGQFIVTADTSVDTEEPDDSSVHVVVLPSVSVQFSSTTTDYNIIIIF